MLAGLIMLNISKTGRLTVKKNGFLSIKSVLIALSSNLQHLLGVMVAQFVLATGWFFTISLHRYFLLLSLGTHLLYRDRFVDFSVLSVQIKSNKIRFISIHKMCFY